MKERTFELIFSCFRLMQYIIRGMAGLQGPFYGGTNTFHRRNTIYGLYPHEIETEIKGLIQIHEISYS